MRASMNFNKEMEHEEDELSFTNISLESKEIDLFQLA
jgi:hypothetical protein